MRVSDKTPYVLRDFERTDDDYRGVAEVATAILPDYPVSAAQLKRDDEERNRDLLFGRVVAVMGDRIVASVVYGQAEGSLRPGKFFFYARVHPDHRCIGIGDALYRHVLKALSRHELALLTTHTREDRTGALHFLAKRGFEVVMRNTVLRLDVRAFDEARFLSRRPRKAKPAVTLSALSDLTAQTPDWQQRCWDLDWELVQDVPMADSPTRLPLERYAKMFEHPNFTADSWFIAHRGEDWIGMSTLWTNPETPRRVYTGITGVRRGFRRQGIATALKLRGIAHVKQQGGHVIETDNEDNNPMRDLNLALGFAPMPALLTFHKSF